MVPVSDSTPDATTTTEPLTVAALETERHVAGSGWDQNPRVFALVHTAALLEAEPQLAADLGAADQAPGALTAIEQEDLPKTASLEELLGQMAWPETVDGAALAVERIVLPPEAEQELPEDPDAAMSALAEHPRRQDVRLLVAVHRDGRSVCLLRQRAHDRDDRVATGEDIAPGLVHALRTTLED
ncbi:PPA1309 family protein [Janibacter corallicola]|uniref:PPA1309 family protein n=1 Tax=Janibacter corallicola TaxID=415212 RepID=UPI00082A7BF6|nr:PPA1309 family protein [Janibacter corallicola]